MCVWGGVGGYVVGECEGSVAGLLRSIMNACRGLLSLLSSCVRLVPLVPAGSSLPQPDRCASNPGPAGEGDTVQGMNHAYMNTAIHTPPPHTDFSGPIMYTGMSAV